MENGRPLIVIEQVELLRCPEWTKTVTLSQFAQTFELHPRQTRSDDPEGAVVRHPDALEGSSQGLWVE